MGKKPVVRYWPRRSKAEGNEARRRSNLVKVIDLQSLIKTEGEGSGLKVKKLKGQVTYSRSSTFKCLIKTEGEEAWKQSNLVKVIDFQISHQD